jgi:hypothetical protein
MHHVDLLARSAPAERGAIETYAAGREDLRLT